ncbi:MAG: hypothetical protein ABJF04_24885 [Reichenbachiella sp.]|uniref:hypothetical protein n=1 Tax=Reichenbachiella sp. TaxID=2184521 RepID=UPI00326462EE
MKTGWMLVMFAMSLMLSCNSANKDQEGSVINIYPDQVIGENFIGNGVQWSAYPHADASTAEWGNIMTDAKWDTLYSRLDYMKPQFIRIFDMAEWRYFRGLDENGTPINDFDSEEVQSLFKILDYCQKNNITVLFGEIGSAIDPKSDANDLKWIQMIVDYLNFLIIDKGYTCIKIYDLVNEPNGYWSSADGNWEEWKSGIKRLDSAFKSNKLDRYIAASGPGSVPQFDNEKSEVKGSEWLPKSVDELNDQIGYYDVHAYVDQAAIRNGTYLDYLSVTGVMDKVNATGKPFFLGELGLKEWGGETKARNDQRIKDDPHASDDSNMRVYDFDYGVDLVDATIQGMNAGVDGVVVWDLDDAMHTLGDTGDTTKLKRWGFWNILGTEICGNPKDEEIRPGYYPWSWMCKYFPNGSTILRSDTTGFDKVRLTAARYGDDYSVALVNNSNRNQAISVNLNYDSQMDLNSYGYYPDQFNQQENQLTIVSEVRTSVALNEPMSVHLPAGSVVVLTTINY